MTPVANPDEFYFRVWKAADPDANPDGDSGLVDFRDQHGLIHGEFQPGIALPVSTLEEAKTLGLAIWNGMAERAHLAGWSITDAYGWQKFEASDANTLPTGDQL